MFESAELGRKLNKKTFQQREPEVREALLDAQLRLKESSSSALIVIAGAEGSGKGDTVNLLLDWFDSRGIETHALGEPSEEEIERPSYFRYWRRLPPAGGLAIFFGSWYTGAIARHSLGKMDEAQFEDHLRRIVDFERTLADNGVLLIKIWLHITKGQQKRRFKKLSRNRETAWRVTKRDWEYHRTYDQFVLSASRAIRRTDRAHASWHVIEAQDARYRNLKVAETVLASIETHLEDATQPPAANGNHALPAPAPVNIISTLDLSLAVDPADYRRELTARQLAVGRLSRDLLKQKRSAVVVFEGMDAAGKGGCIRRLTQSIDARTYRVIPISAPTDEESAHPYLWRFWRQLPRWGHITIYDRSWYGRVLVERIEGLIPSAAWRRAYAEINAFEEQLTSSGVLVLKFWLATSKDEQLTRFKDREARGYKRYKITPEDWRNREKWDGYIAAACDMIERTSTEIAPWTLVEANDKYHARLKVLRTVEAGLERALATR